MLNHMLQTSAQVRPDKAALVYGDTRISYAELDRTVGHVSGGLRHLGVAATDGVALVLPNCPEFIISLFACARLGAIMLPLNPQYTKDEMKRFLVDAQVKLIITDTPRAVLCQQLMDEIDFPLRLIVVGEPVEGSEPFQRLVNHPTPVATTETLRSEVLYLYTSGSTDEYKRMCCTQENLYYEAHNFVETVGLTSDDNILCAIPLYHSYGLGNCLLDAAYTGATLVLLEPDMENGVAVETPFVGRTARALELMQQEDIRFFPAVPYQLATLTELPDVTAADFAGLKWVISSGDVLPETTYRRFLERFGIAVRSLYGSTEAGSICMNTDPVETVQFGALGLPLANVDIQIRDDHGRECAPNDSGNIWVKSPVIPPGGYDNRPQQNLEVFQNGYYHTGDVGKKDDRGHLWITGRKQTFVDVGGYKVDIGEVEEVLLGHPQIREAAALGVEMPQVGEVIKAVLVPDTFCSEADILAYCREYMAAFKIPRLIEFRQALPRSPIGKVLKKELHDAAPLTSGVDGENDAAAAELQASRLYETLAGMTQAQQIDTLAAQLQTQVAETLQVETTAIPRSESFRNLGFDSIRAAELHSRVVHLTGLPLSITMLWNYPTIEALTASLWERLQAHLNVSPEGVPRSTTQPELPAAQPQPTSSLDAMLDELDTLSEGEIDDFFQRRS